VTGDAAQALPLHLLRNLSCGESVVILSDSEGYTVHVRSADGTAGYVARLYLNMGAAPSVPDHQPLSATAVNNVVRWQAGAPGCDQFFSKGHTVESPPTASPSRSLSKIPAGNCAPQLPFSIEAKKLSRSFPLSLLSTNYSLT
jgi:hypothetical protein